MKCKDKKEALAILMTEKERLDNEIMNLINKYSFDFQFDNKDFMLIHLVKLIQHKINKKKYNKCKENSDVFKILSWDKNSIEEFCK